VRSKSAARDSLRDTYDRVAPASGEQVAADPAANCAPAPVAQAADVEDGITADYGFSTFEIAAG
jgi:hypothetical protein